MNTLKGDWNIVVGKLKQGLGKLTGDDGEFESGQEQELFGQIQKHTSSEQSANRALDQWGVLWHPHS